MSDNHYFTLTLDDGEVSIAVVCMYPPTDTKRPCWPRDEDGVAEEGPTNECTYEGWVDNLAAADFVHGQARFVLRGEVQWNPDFELHVR